MPNSPTLNPPLSPPPTGDDAAAAAQNQPAQASRGTTRQQLQTSFLTGLLNQTVTVYLVNGIRLSGTLKQFDSFTLLLQDANDIGTLVFKHAISTLVPGLPVVSAGPKERRTPFGKLAEWKR